MSFELRDYQVDAAATVAKYIRKGFVEYRDGGDLRTVSLSAPTGAGKTVIATAVIEHLLFGDDQQDPNPNTAVLWVTDDPNLNEQTKSKMLVASEHLQPKQLKTVDQSFDQRTFTPGRIYFINIQKLGKGATNYVKAARGEPGGRKFSLWETIKNTIDERGSDFVLIVDEAHRGTAAKSGGGKSITTQLVEGADGKLPPAPIVLGISATPDKFVAAINKAQQRALYQVNISLEDVRASGLLKDKVGVRNPAESQPGDMTLVEMAVEDLKSYSEQWAKYAAEESEPLVKPLLVIQVKAKVSDAELSKLLDTLRSAWDVLDDKAIGHSFQEHTTLDLGTRTVRYVKPQHIEDDPYLRAVLFKEALTTGWDCPRAEVMVSLRTAKDYTYIAQLIGRMVRTPLARRIATNDVLNTVALYLPHYDDAHVSQVIDLLHSGDNRVVSGIELDPVTCKRDTTLPAGVWETLSALPTYTRPAKFHRNEVARLNAFAALLVKNDLDDAAMSAARQRIIDTLSSERGRLGAAFDDKVAGLEELEYKTQTFDLATKDVVAETGTVAVSAANIDDLFRQSRRILGDAAARWFWEQLCTDGEDPTEAKLIVAALADEPSVVETLNKAAKTLTDTWSKEHGSAIAKLGDAARDRFSSIWAQAKEPAQVPLIIPEQISAPTKRIVGTGDDRSTVPVERHKGHLFVNGKKTFPAHLTGWEAETLAVVQADAALKAWYRNPTGGPSALAVPYEDAGSDAKQRTMYPDFVFFYDDGSIVADIIDPHQPNQGDTKAKWLGLAAYAAEHAEKVRRVLAVIKDGERLLALDLKRDDVVQKLGKVDGEADIRSLFKQLGAVLD